MASWSWLPIAQSVVTEGKRRRGRRRKGGRKRREGRKRETEEGREKEKEEVIMGKPRQSLESTLQVVCEGAALYCSEQSLLLSVPTIEHISRQ